MADRTFVQPSVLDKGVVVISGSFAPNGSSAVSAASNKGTGWSVARTGVGTFTITLADKYPALLAATATVQLATAANTMVQFNSIDVVSARTVLMTILTAGAAADVAANANNRVNFTLVLKNSSATP